MNACHKFFAATRWPLERPFGKPYWFFTLALSAVFFLDFALLPCEQRPRYFEVCYLTVTVVSAFWLGVRSADGLNGLKKWARIAGSILLSLGYFLLLAFAMTLLSTIFVGTYECYNDRAKVSELILAASSYREPVETNITKLHSLDHAGEGIEFRAQGRVHAGGISANGTIIVLGEEPTALIMLKPALENGIVSWQCSGFPVRVLPASCREPPKF
jgi:type IV pilus assembly protein PilA